MNKCQIIRTLPTRFFTTRIIDLIVIHCTDSYYHSTCNDIDDWHNARGFNGIGYNFVVDKDGYIYYGRNIDLIPAHVKGYNSHSIGIAWIGGYGNSNPITEIQYQELLKITSVLMRSFGLTINEVKGHREMPNVHKTCPCIDMDKFRNDLRNFQKKKDNSNGLLKIIGGLSIFGLLYKFIKNN